MRLAIALLLALSGWAGAARDTEDPSFPGSGEAPRAAAAPAAQAEAGAAAASGEDRGPKGRPSGKASSKKARRPAKPAPRVELPDEDQPDQVLVSQPDPVHGVHLTGWAAGTPKFRARFIQEVKEAGLNTVVIALKEYDGRMFVRGVPLAHETGAFVNAIPDLPGCVAQFKAAGLRTVGRIVLFKDNILARKRPEWAVKTPDGAVWRNNNGVAWVDPYRREVWDYNLAIASRAAAAGFDEIQFDYVRFPSDGDVKLCRYSREHTPSAAVANIRQFLATARQALKPFRVAVSICVFGMTSSAHDDMGIGQKIGTLTEEVDAVCPMMYPSHYRKGELGVKNPNREPFRIIRRSVRDAVVRLGPQAAKLRPYFQDFSLGVRYDAEKVRSQLLAARRFGVTSWILWNPQNKYTWSAFKQAGQNVLDPAPPPAAPAVPVSTPSETPAGEPSAPPTGEPR